MSEQALPRRVQAFIESERLFTKNERLLVAVSAGLDSTTLAHLLVELGYHIALIHCNYQLRGIASEEDETFVQQLGDRWGVAVYTRKFTVADAALEGDSLQMTCRKLRYSYFEKILDEYNYSRVVTAHHLDDNLETLLINLLRGTGVTGLAGIRPSRDRIVRPLLSITRAELLRYAEDRGLEWREDRSNDTDDYLRNRLRHQILPRLRELGLHPATLARTMRRLRSESKLTDSMYGAIIESITSRVDDYLIVDKQRLPTEAEVNLRVFERIAAPYGFTYEQCRQMLNIEKRTTLTGTAGWVEITKELLTFGFGAVEAAEGSSLTIDTLPVSLRDSRLVYRIELIDRPPVLNKPGDLYLSPPPLPLRVRRRAPGDRMQPLGMNGKSRSLKKIYNDLKLSEAAKNRTFLLCTADDEVVAIMGRRISEAYRVTESDRKVLCISVKKMNPGQS